MAVPPVGSPAGVGLGLDSSRHPAGKEGHGWSSWLLREAADAQPHLGQTDRWAFLPSVGWTITRAPFSSKHFPIQRVFHPPAHLAVGKS